MKFFTIISCVLVTLSCLPRQSETPVAQPSTFVQQPKPALQVHTSQAQAKIQGPSAAKLPIAKKIAQ